jgi:hypothetical protein
MAFAFLFPRFEQLLSFIRDSTLVNFDEMLVRR